MKWEENEFLNREVHCCEIGIFTAEIEKNDKGTYDWCISQDQEHMITNMKRAKTLEKAKQEVESWAISLASNLLEDAGHGYMVGERQYV